MYVPHALNGLVMRMWAFGLCSWIVIGRQNQLDCLSNNNKVEQTKRPFTVHLLNLGIVDSSLRLGGTLNHYETQMIKTNLILFC